MNPLNMIQPIDPTTELIQPTNPINPIQPIDPVNPIQPIDPTIELTQPIELTIDPNAACRPLKLVDPLPRKRYHTRSKGNIPPFAKKICKGTNIF